MFENYISKMAVILLKGKWVNSCPGQNGRYYADDIFMCIFVKGNFCILIKDSLNFVPNGLIENYPALVEIYDPVHGRIYAAPGMS